MVDLERMLVKHGPSDDCHGHCYSHHVDEPGRGYITCIECGHLYRTKRDLRRAYRRGFRQTVQPRRLLSDDLDMGWGGYLWRLLTVRASTIYFCQECSHDF